MYKYIVALFLMTLLVVPTLTAQSLKATVRADSNAMLIGDHLRLLISVEAPKGVTVTMPDLASSLKASAWELISLEEPKVEPLDGGQNMHQVELKVTAWEAGDKQIPALNFTANDAGAPQTASSQAINIRIDAPPVVDSTFVADIKTIIEVPTSWWDYWLYFLIVGAVLLLAYPTYLLVKKYRAGTLFPKAIPETIESIALKKLAALEGSDLLPKKQFVEYHAQASFILREYLQARFQVRALYITTLETMLTIGGHPQILPQRDAIQEVLETADLVKFAKASPLDAAHVFAIATIRKLVESIAEELRLEALRLAEQKKQRATNK
jgi:hypothetical protein